MSLMGRVPPSRLDALLAALEHFEWRIADIASGGFNRNTQIIADRFARLLAGDTITHAQTGILAKDIRLALDLARSLGAAVPLGEQAGAAFAAALQAGLGDEDDAALARLYWSP